VPCSPTEHPRKDDSALLDDEGITGFQSVIGMSREPIKIEKYNDVLSDFGNQYDNFEEEIDDKFSDPRMKELPITIFVESNHGHDMVTGKSITGVIIFVGRTPIKYFSKRQSSVQNSTFGVKFVYETCSQRSGRNQILSTINGSPLDETRDDIWGQ